MSYINYLFWLAQIFKLNIQYLQFMLAKLRTSVKKKQPGIHYYENFYFPKLPSMRIACVQRIAAAAGSGGDEGGRSPTLHTATATPDPDSKTVPSLQ